MALSNRVISITEENYVPASIDGILNSNVFYSRLFMRDTKDWSGRQVMIPLQYAKPTSGGSFDGMGDFNTSLQDTRVRQTFSHAQFYQNVSVAGGEASLNKTDGEVLDLVKITMEEAQNAASDSIGDQLYDVGAGTDFLGLGAIVDNGTNTSTYAGLSRTSYPMLNSAIVPATSGVVDFGLMANVMRGAAAAGARRARPSIIITDETSWDLVESKYTATTQNNYESITAAQITTMSKPGSTIAGGQSLGEGQMGFECLRWRGMPLVADEKCDAGAQFFLNEEYLTWYSLQGIDLTSYEVASQVDGVYSEYKKTYPLQWTGFQKPTTQYARIGQFIALGNVISGGTRRHGKSTGITQA